jgi:hypothetical protein
MQPKQKWKPGRAQAFRAQVDTPNFPANAVAMPEYMEEGAVILSQGSSSKGGSSRRKRNDDDNDDDNNEFGDAKPLQKKSSWWRSHSHSYGDSQKALTAKRKREAEKPEEKKPEKEKPQQSVLAKQYSILMSRRRRTRENVALAKQSSPDDAQQLSGVSPTSDGAKQLSGISPTSDGAKQLSGVSQSDSAKQLSGVSRSDSAKQLSGVSPTSDGTKRRKTVAKARSLILAAAQHVKNTSRASIPDFFRDAQRSDESVAQAREAQESDAHAAESSTSVVEGSDAHAAESSTSVARAEGSDAHAIESSTSVAQAEESDAHAAESAAHVPNESELPNASSTHEDSENEPVPAALQAAYDRLNEEVPDDGEVPDDEDSVSL